MIEALRRRVADLHNSIVLPRALAWHRNYAALMHHYNATNFYIFPLLLRRDNLPSRTSQLKEITIAINQVGGGCRYVYK